MSEVRRRLVLLVATRKGACCSTETRSATPGRSTARAYVRGLADYLIIMWHPSTRPSAMEPRPPGLRWLGLEVRRCAIQDGDHATVEFVARSKLGGRAQRLHEISRFVCEQGRWYYVDGELR